MPELSVVLITRNQEWNIDRLIQSVLQATCGQEGTEVVLVDSASSDQTIRLAQEYPITVLRLNDGEFMTPAAGRFVGYNHTTGSMVLFLDGDMELIDGWLPQALELLSERREVAVVSGLLIDVTTPGQRIEVPVFEAGTALGPPEEVRHGGGAALYRRSVLERVGGFNPYLFSDEEPELCLRVRQSGHHVVRLQWPIVFHYSSPREEVATILARRRRNLYLGCGQSLRYKIGTELFWPYVRERGHGLIPVVAMAAGLFVLALGGLTGTWWPFGAWVAILAASVFADAIQKRSLRRPLATLVKRLVIADGTVRGFFRQPLMPETYDPSLTVIRLQADQPDGLDVQMTVPGPDEYHLSP